MIQPHIIAVDLDGTLLTKRKQITERTKATLKKARENGHHVVISTGRSYRGSKNIYEELDLDTPIINYNGSYVHHPMDIHFQVEHTPIQFEIAMQIIENAYKNGITNIFAEVLQDVYAHKLKEPFHKIFFLENGRLIEGDILENLRENPTCLLISTEEDSTDNLRKYLEENHKDIIEFKSWGAPFHIIEMNKLGITKAHGLKKIAEYYQIPKERIIAFGDEDNDLEMIKYAGHGVAMGNGIPELKEAANVVTLTNEEDGVAVYLDKILQL